MLICYLLIVSPFSLQYTFPFFTPPNLSWWVWGGIVFVVLMFLLFIMRVRKRRNEAKQLFYNCIDKLDNQFSQIISDNFDIILLRSPSKTYNISQLTSKTLKELKPTLYQLFKLLKHYNHFHFPKKTYFAYFEDLPIFIRLLMDNSEMVNFAEKEQNAITTYISECLTAEFTRKVIEIELKIAQKYPLIKVSKK